MMARTEKAALVTGARAGLGGAIARALAMDGTGAGVGVGVGVRRKGDGESTVAAIAAAGGTAREILWDAADNAAAARAAAECEAAFGRLDVLVNNAGAIEPIGALAEIAPEEFARNLQVNVVGAFALTRAAWPLLEKSGGRVVNILSGAARTALFGWPAYCASKAALLMLTRSVDLEGKPKGIRCFGFAPGLVDTDMQRVIRESGVNEISRLPRSALAPPAAAARAVAWLASGEADDLAGEYSDIRDPELRRRAGLAAE